MKLQSFDKSNLPLVRAEIEKALKAVADQYGLTIRTKNIKFTAYEFTVPLEVRIEGKQSAFSDVLGYPKLGLEFTSNGKKFTVSGHNPSRPKYPITAHCITDGREYKFPANHSAFVRLKAGQ